MAIELEMSVGDYTPDVDALSANQMLFNASTPLQSLPFVHAFIREHTAHTSGRQISFCEGQEPKA